MKLTVSPALPSLSRVHPNTRKPVRLALVQTRWHSDPDEHLRVLESGIAMAAENGACAVFLPELTLNRYFADSLPNAVPNTLAEDLETGPTIRFAKEMADRFRLVVHISLFAKVDSRDGRGLNIACLVAPEIGVIAKTPKLHIPVTAGYYENRYFAPGPSNPDPYPVYHLAKFGVPGKFGLPTCWDEWFPEVARNYSLRGAEVLVYPTAIGSEPDHPDFDTEPLWRQVIVGNGISNGTFMVVPNRYGNEGSITFYGSSFISDPFGRILVRAGREGDEVLVADLDLDQRRDWLDLFPFLATRRPDTYGKLVEAVVNPRAESGAGEAGGIAGVAH